MHVTNLGCQYICAHMSQMAARRASNQANRLLQAAHWQSQTCITATWVHTSYATALFRGKTIGCSTARVAAKLELPSCMKSLLVAKYGGELCCCASCCHSCGPPSYCSDQSSTAAILNSSLLAKHGLPNVPHVPLLPCTHAAMQVAAAWSEQRIDCARVVNSPLCFNCNLGGTSAEARIRPAASTA